MKKYMILALLPFAVQAESWSSSRSSKSMSQLNSAVDRYINDVKSSTDDVNSRMLNGILDDLSSYAKIGSNEYENSMLQVQRIKETLEAKRNQIYHSSSFLTKFTWSLGKYPSFVSSEIDPAILEVKTTYQGIYYYRLMTTLQEVGYATGRVAGIAAIAAAGAAIGGAAVYYSNKNSSSSSPSYSSKSSAKNAPEEFVLKPRPNAPSRESSVPTKSLPVDEDPSVDKDPNGWGENNPFE